jgi:site-specific DNA-cytosine methylase
MIGWDLLTGIGGVACGMDKAGVEHVMGVECDPSDRMLSEAFIEIHKMNGWGRTYLMTVQDYAMWGFPGMPIGAKIAHFSPVCADYSIAQFGTPSHANMAIAVACMDAIAHGKPENFTMEQVPNYAKSPEFAYIKERAIALGYTFNHKSICIGAQFGQSRKRLIVTASLSGNWRSPIQPAVVSWYKVIEDLIPTFAPIAPTERQLNAAAAWYYKNRSTYSPKNPPPLYVERVTSGKFPKARGSLESIPTLMKSKFRDTAFNGRSNVSCLYLPEGDRWLNLNLEAYSRLSGFPPTFVYPNSPKITGSGFGYCVPPLWYASLLKSMP